MRPFRITDLDWIAPFAIKQEQFLNLLVALERLAFGLVIPKEVVVVVWDDGHGWVIGGLTNLPHVKSAIKLMKHVIDTAKRRGDRLHSHDAEGTLGRKICLRYGFAPDGDAVWLNKEAA